MAVVTAQEPVSRLQQAPWEGVQLTEAQVEPGPWKELVPVQPLAVVMEQAPSGAQQAPLRALQGLVEQVWPATKVPGMVQPPWVVTVQAAMPEQQAPSSGLQVVVEQVVPAPRKELVPVQPVGMEMVHPPTALQQAP
jgi:hypothetical protein